MFRRRAIQQRRENTRRYAVAAKTVREESNAMSGRGKAPRHRKKDCDVRRVAARGVVYPLILLPFFAFVRLFDFAAHMSFMRLSPILRCLSGWLSPYAITLSFLRVDMAHHPPGFTR